MKNKLMYGCRLLCLLCVVQVAGWMLAGEAFAGRLQYSQFLFGNNVVPGASITVSDDLWPEIATGYYTNFFHDKKVRNYVKLHFANYGQVIYSCDSSFSVKVDIRWNGFDKNNVYQNGTATLIVGEDYVNHTSAETDLVEITSGFEGLHFLQVRVDNVTYTGITGPAIVFLETGIEVDRYFNLDEDDSEPELLVEDDLYGPENKLTLRWPWVYGAEEYDLEWYFLSENVEDYSTLTMADIDPEAFTRITLPQNSYDLNMAFDKGKVFFRVRGVGRFGERFEDVLEGEWSDDIGADEYVMNRDFVDYGAGTVSDNEYRIKNWTYQQSFAEGGKHKEVLSFFDGSGRNRQSVTLSNTDSITIVGETYYDFEGRPVIAALPTPTSDYAGTMQYFKSFAINNGTDHILIKPEYDVADDGNICEPEGLELKTSEGASRYYSPDNPAKNAFQQYLPDAFMYPYSRTRFDAEGRAVEQAGPGETFNLAGGHTVTGFYATPSQEALNRMLGSQAGYASHYMLEGVEDANGQVALTYKDMSGKVVATSLTGVAPTQLESLESNTGAIGFTQSLSSTFQELPVPAYVTSQTILLPAAGDYDFTYTVNLEDYAGLCGDSTGKCKYDLVLSVYDQCNQELTVSNETEDAESINLVYESEPISFSAYESPDPGNTETFTFTIHVDKAGPYVVSKTLTLNEDHFNEAVGAYELYLQEHLPEACIEELGLPVLPCGVSCAEYCLTHECPPGFCDINTDGGESPCDGILDVLIADMSPGGQYFDGNPGNLSGINASWFTTNLIDPFNSSASLCTLTCAYDVTLNTFPFWCSLSAINSGVLGGNSFSDWAGLRAYMVAHSITADELEIPFPLSSCSYTGNKPLVEFHPEYCHYTRCMAESEEVGDKTSDEFDMDIVLADYDNADLIKDWIDPSSPCSTGVDYSAMLAADPLETTSGGAFGTFVNGISWPVTSGTDMWDEAVALCGCGTDCEQIWNVFKGLYAHAKESYLNTVIGCTALCDTDVPQDQMADNCGGSTVAVGYHINFPGVSGDLYDEVPGLDTDPDSDVLVENAEDFSYTCKNYIDINFCDMLADMCSVTCQEPPLTNDIGAVYCGPICEASNWDHQPFNLYINNIGQIPLFTGPVPFPTYTFNSAIGPLIDYGYDFGDCTLSGFDMNTFLTNLVTVMNGSSAASGPNWDVMHLDDCTVRIFLLSNTDHSGELVRIGYGQSNGPTLALANSCVYNVGLIEYECQEVNEMQDCACDWLSLDFNALTEQYPDLTAETIYMMMADAYELDFAGTSVDPEDVEEWLANCNEFNVPCTDPEGSDCMPGALLADCSAEPEDCEEEEQNVIDYYEGLNVQEQIDSLVTLFKQHYVDECFGGDFAETFTYEGDNWEYHYTLYQYDQAGNLTSTVPPKGVKLVPESMFALVDAQRNDPGSDDYRFVDPGHGMKSMYRYNSYNLVMEENVPDKQDMVEGTINGHSATGDFLQIQMLNASNGYAIVDDGGYKIKYTTNGGSSWSDVSGFTLPGSATALSQIHFFTDDNVIATTNNGVYISHNKGVTWGSQIVIDLYDGFALNGLDILYAYKTNGEVDKFTLSDPLDAAFDATLSLAIIGSGFTTNMNAIEYNQANDYLILSNVNGSNNLHIVYGLDGTPAVETKTISGITIHDIELVDPLVIIVGGVNSGDPKIKWIPIIADPTPDIGSVNPALISAGTGTVNSFASANGIIYAAGTNEIMMASSDYGLTWSSAFTSGFAPTIVNYFSVAVAPGSNNIVFGGDVNVPTITDAKASDQKYYYDQLGRIKASQNTKQRYKGDGAFSYSVYDAEGRVTEAGEAESAGTLLAPTASEMNDYAAWPGNWLSGGESRKEVTLTTYDASLGDTDVDNMFAYGEQLYLRRRVSTIRFYDDYTDPMTADYQYAAHYSYDIHGNVNEFVREYKPLDGYGQRFKKFDYIYDLVSGNTLNMKYQEGELDYFEHRYGYDGNNNLKWASTTRNGLTWDDDAKYFYYLHGALARMEIGQLKVQGMDYAYTLDGKLKGVNSGALDAEKDMGQDGKVSALNTTPYIAAYNNIHTLTGRDAFGYVLGYYGNDTLGDRDYSSITATTNGNRWLCKIPVTTGLGDNLYNGNIRHVAMAMFDINEAAIENRATAYTYDQLNRIKVTNNYMNTGTGYSSILSSTSNGFEESFGYDANGNMMMLERDNASEVQYDDFTYNYYGNTNRLHFVGDAEADGTETGDMDNQAAGNYTYDEIGQLTADVKEGVDAINWNVRQKVQQVEKSDGSKLLFEYDEMGHRVKKEEQSGNENMWTQQWYVMDPSGNPVAVYEHTYADGATTNNYQEQFNLKEHQIYGADRVGTSNNLVTLYRQNFSNSTFDPDGSFGNRSNTLTPTIPRALAKLLLNKRTLGNKRYELKGHTNNVLAVITDYRIPKSIVACTTGATIAANHYLPDVVSYTDYYAFGAQMLLPRNGAEAGVEYRYGMGGQEQDKEIAGEGNSYTAEYWQYDPRLGRRWNVDPIIKFHESPYAAFANNPICFADPNGADSINVVSKSLNSKGEALGSNDTPLYLFTVYTNDNQKGSMTSAEFSSKYQMLTDNSVQFSVDGIKQKMKSYAKFIKANSDIELLSKAINVTTLNDFHEFFDRALAWVGEEFSNYEKWSGFSHGDEYDYKSQVAGDKPFTFIQGLGLYSSDHVGNILYGMMIRSTGGTSGDALHNGDFLQRNLKYKGWGFNMTVNNVDDPYDSFSLLMGYNTGKRLTPGAFKTVLSLNKSTTIISNVMVGMYKVNNRYDYTYTTKEGTKTTWVETGFLSK